MPPSAFVVSFARCAIAPLMPDARDVREPARLVGARPRAVADAAEVDLARRAVQRDVDRVARCGAGSPAMRAKSQPVPRGMTAISTSRCAMPFATSFTEPSPPTTTSSSAPPSTASPREVAQMAGPLREERVAGRGRARAAAFASCGQRRPVAPLSDAGLTRKTALSRIRRRGRERDPRHAVDRRAQLVVRDPLELSLDDDVADREQRSRRPRRAARRA